jgi:chromosome segregation ATPase
MAVEQVESRAVLSVRNIGGIDRTEVTFEPGVTVLTGRNATNRTSLLQAIMAVLGSNDVSIKADTDEAYVELELAGETYTRTLTRQNSTAQASGEPYLEDSTLADLFAFLLESNEARRAVVMDTDLRDIIMCPVNTDEIQAEVDRLIDKRRQVSEELDELEDLKGRLPSLEEQRTRLQDEIEETTAQLAEIEAEIEARNADVEQSREEQDKVEAKLDKLREVRSTLENVRYDLETEQESLESLRVEKQEIEQEYEALPEAPAEDLQDLGTRIDQLRTQKQTLETELNEVQSVIGFNEERLEDGAGTFDDMFDDDDAGSVTDELLPENTVTCWTCGSDVETAQIETTIDKLRDLSEELVGNINDIENELADLTEQRSELQEQQRRREQLQHRLEELDTELDETNARIEELSERRDALREDVESIEAEVEALEHDAYEELLELHKEANQLEYGLGQLENDLERVEGNIDLIEDRLADEADLKDRREEINDEIEALRTRIERIEKGAIEEFNNHMETVLELLEYENLARIWLERRETEVRDDRQTVTKSIFELHVVRQTEFGTTYEDTVDNLSESEREVTGLIFALSGYLIHDVYEAVPFMLLDSVEALDTARVATLVDYLDDFSEYLVVALLPEYDVVLGEDYPRIKEI